MWGGISLRKASVCFPFHFCCLLEVSWLLTRRTFATLHLLLLLVPTTLQQLARLIFLKQQKHSYQLPCSRALKESYLLSKFSKRSLASFLTFYVSLIYIFCISHLTIVILQNLSEIIPRSLSWILNYSKYLFPFPSFNDFFIVWYFRQARFGNNMMNSMYLPFRFIESWHYAELVSDFSFLI